jgi:UDP-N-acetylmuramoylalanine--D-glutamate ligase
MESHGAHTIVFGLGVTGLSCLRYLHGRDRLTVVDTRDRPPGIEDAQRAFPDVSYVCGAALDAALLATAERIVVSPGLPLSHPLLRDAQMRGVPCIGDIDLFCEAVQAPVAAITGTNGKSTATALAGELATAAGLDVGVGGNLGTAALDLLGESRNAYVLELSSFQLERLDEGRFDVASVMNVTPDHLDRYRDLDEYATAKRRIYRDARVAIFNRADPMTLPPASIRHPVSIGLDAPSRDTDWGIEDVRGARCLMRGNVPVIESRDLGIRGRHNEFNAMTALAAVDALGVDVANVGDVLRRFRGLPHRCQTVTEIGGVTFIDDSKATNLGAAVAALEGLGDERRRHIVLIAGGDAKGADLTPLGEVVGRFVHDVVVLGRDAEIVAKAVHDHTDVTRVRTIEEAVFEAHRASRPGDVVLLSPACASLDMFRNYEARGRAFVDAVRRLEP